MLDDSIGQDVYLYGIEYTADGTIKRVVEIMSEEDARRWMLNKTKGGGYHTTATQEQAVKIAGKSSIEHAKRFWTKSNRISLESLTYSGQSNGQSCTDCIHYRNITLRRGKEEHRREYCNILNRLYCAGGYNCNWYKPKEDDQGKDDVNGQCIE